MKIQTQNSMEHIFHDKIYEMRIEKISNIDSWKTLCIESQAKLHEFDKIMVRFTNMELCWTKV